MKLQSPLFTASFTDAYGVEHPAAQCFVASVNRSTNATFGAPGEATVEGTNINFQVRFWHSEATKAAGARLQDFVDKNGMTNFSFTANEVADADLVQACVNYFNTTVLGVKA